MKKLLLILISKYYIKLLRKALNNSQFAAIWDSSLDTVVILTSIRYNKKLEKKLSIQFMEAHKNTRKLRSLLNIDFNVAFIFDFFEDWRDYKFHIDCKYYKELFNDIL